MTVGWVVAVRTGIGQWFLIVGHLLFCNQMTDHQSLHDLFGKSWLPCQRNGTRQIVAFGLMRAMVTILSGIRNIYSRRQKPWVMLTGR